MIQVTFTIEIQLLQPREVLDSRKVILSQHKANFCDIIIVPDKQIVEILDFV